jgi:hypothetical protein
MFERLAGKVAVFTGASNGVGRDAVSGPASVIKGACLIKESPTDGVSRLLCRR